MPTELGPAGSAAAGTLVVLALGEHFLEVVAGAAAYLAAWWLLREPTSRTESPG